MTELTVVLSEVGLAALIAK